MPDRLILSSHECVPRWDFTKFMGGDRVCWVGEVTDPPDGYDQEVYCLHVRTAEKPPLVFGLNRGDLEFLQAMLYAIFRSEDKYPWPLNEDWLDSISDSAAVSDPESVATEPFGHQ